VNSGARNSRIHTKFAGRFLRRGEMRVQTWVNMVMILREKELLFESEEEGQVHTKS
jgi:hypothetical protein